jgi:DNA-directed RNA polymerase beta subunit
VKGEEQWEFYFDSYTRDNRLVIRNEERPTLLTPSICRLRDLTYQGLIKAKLHCTKYRINTKTEREKIKERIFPNVVIAEVPIMVGSEWCCLEKDTEKERV